MPLVRVDMMEGRTPEQVANMIRGISHAIATALDAPIDTIRVVVNEMQAHQYGVGGKPWPEVVEERRRAAQEEAQA